MEALGGEPEKINPLQAAELVIDHSVQVDKFGSPDAAEQNAKIEFERNMERYQFLKWGQQAFDNFKVVPPDTGIVHQVNVEYLARVVFAKEHGGITQAYPDTVVGTDSHTTMVNGIGVLGWGVGGIEAEAAMLGQPISMLVPQVVGMKLTGRLPEGATATDLVLTIVERLRQHGVVGKFVEFFGPGLDHLPMGDRATIANMGPEYGATCGLFPIDEETINYMRLTGRSEDQVALTETYAKSQGMWRDDSAEAEYSEKLELDISTIAPSLAGPKRPQDRIELANAKSQFVNTDLPAMNSSRDASKTGSVATRINDEDVVIEDGAVAIAAITSCTNTSNPSVMIGAGLVAKKAVEKGLMVKPWVKTSLAPGSMVVSDYLTSAGLLDDLKKLGFHIVGYGCTTCIGNSGPLPEAVSQAIHEGDLTVTSVLSGNRNFEGRVHAEVKMNYLASPPLVVAYAIAGNMNVDLLNEPLGQDQDGNEVFMKDIWPSQQEIAEIMSQNVTAKGFTDAYADVFKGDSNWNNLSGASGKRFGWNSDSTYIQNPPYFENMGMQASDITDITGARVLAMLGDSVTTDHISPAGAIKADSPAGKYLQDHGVEPKDFNSYGSRRGNHEVMMRGTFANIRLRNLMAPGTEGGITLHMPDAEQMPIYDAAMKYRQQDIPVIVIAGKEYGSGSSRDWAAKGPNLLGVKAVIAESYERIHRTNLVCMGVLPLQFTPGENTESLGLTGHEKFDITGLGDGSAKSVTVMATSADGSQKQFTARVRIDTPNEVEYYRHGGILQYVLRKLAA
jgi:aconitate hydratase